MIGRKGGFTFRYDIGKGAGNAVKGLKKDEILWSKEQIVDGCSIQLALAKDRMLYVTFPTEGANFYGKAKSDEEIADMLLMVLTFAPPAKPK